MIQLVIFSKNRAMQLEALLRSLYQYGHGFFDRVVIIFSSGQGYDESYERLKQIYTKENWVRQDDFKRNVLDSIEDKDGYTCFLVDDIIFSGYFNRDLLKYFTDDVWSFSLRLGLNIDYCYPMDKVSRLNSHWETGDFIKWNYREQADDWGYFISLDGNIFRTNEIKERIGGLTFSNPNELEHLLQTTTHSTRANKLAYKASKLVNIPHNRVNDVVNNRFGGGSEWELQLAFRQGVVIDYGSMDLQTNSPHKEIPYKFRYEGAFDLVKFPNMDSSTELKDYLQKIELDTPEPFVLDIGGYLGDFTQTVLGIYPNAYVHIFEPIKNFADRCRVRFRDNSRVSVFQYGVGKYGGKRDFYVDNLLTSAYPGWTNSGQYESGEVIRLSDGLMESSIDLVSINCEGGEYEIIDDIIDNNFYPKVKNIIIQFHNIFGVEAYSIALEKLNRHYKQVAGNACWSIWRLKE